MLIPHSARFSPSLEVVTLCAVPLPEPFIRLVLTVFAITLNRDHSSDNRLLLLFDFLEEV